MEEGNKKKPIKKPFILRKKHRKFLEQYAQLGDIGDAYMAAGFQSKNKKCASTAGGKLLNKIDQNIDWRQIVEAACPNTALAGRLTNLLHHKDGRVAAAAGGHLAKVKGWVPPEGEGERPIQISIFTGTSPEQVAKGESDQKVIDVTPSKPKQLTE